jgi:transcriptional regulator with XRE-family HTH domain
MFQFFGNTAEGRMVQIPRLREWREARAFTQVELAELAGVSSRSVAGYEAGAGARPPTVRKLAEVLGVEVADLRGDPDSPKAEAPPSQQLTLNGLLAEERRFRPTTREVKNLDLFCTRIERRLDEQGMSPNEIEIALDAVEGFVAVVAATMSDETFDRFISLGRRLLEAAKEREIRNDAETRAGVARLDDLRSRRAG